MLKQIIFMNRLDWQNEKNIIYLSEQQMIKTVISKHCCPVFKPGSIKSSELFTFFNQAKIKPLVKIGDSRGFNANIKS
jgi:hypothetical protein